jgi:structural maintenance of chromosome 3 (chondroitin sulfate proteoglycan 6)
MHIKQIIIQGFKSYKDQTVIEPFSPGLNVIVGRNGSGKSNFFAAIRFVLSDAYTQMGREERNALLHEGSGSAVMSAYVEVIFDNSDERFPTGRPELVLRRTIGMKKDEYSLDRKNATKTDVMNLLESAGFSRSNPYYIVPQGRVTTLTNMKDAERLTLLKEVAGTQVYEARRTESLKIMQETDNKRSKIDHLLGLVEERLEELEEEKEELRKYQEKDREHRCLQYTILFREQQEYERALIAIDEQRSSGVEETDSQRKTMDVLEEELAVLESDIIDSNQKLEYHSGEKERLEDERRDAQKEQAKTELDVQSLTAGQTAAQATKTKHDQELRQVKQLIKSKEQELAGLMPNFNATRDSENNVRYQLEESEAVRRRLFTKQGRMSQFKSKRERDDYLRREVDQIKEQVSKRNDVLRQTTVEIGDLQNDIAGLDSSLADMRGQVESRGADLQTIGSKIEQAKEAHEQLLDRRRELWREQKRVESNVDGLRQKLEKEEHELRNLASAGTIQGIKSVRRIQQQHGISGLYGTLGELFEVNDMYRVAVEATAGDSLFHYVVDNDETATKVMEILNKERAGRVTFMPLNRLKVKNPPMPKSKDAVPMMSKLKYDAKYEIALQYVFGKMVICPNLEVAAQYARSHGVSGITPEGDRADKKGALTGGFRDRRKSRLEAIGREAQCRIDLEEEREKLQSINDQLSSLEPEITKSATVVRKSEQRRAELDSSYAPLYDDIRRGRSQLHAKREALEAKERAKDNISTDLRKLGEERAAYEKELASDFKKGLTNAEAEQLESLGGHVQDLRTQLTSLTSTRSQLEARKSGLEVELRENLRPRLDQLNAQEVEFGVDGSSTSGNAAGRLKERQRALKRARKVLQDIESQLAEVDAVLEEESRRLAVFQSQKAEKQQKQDELQRAIERHQKKMEKSMQKKALVLENLAESKRGIRDLGTLPDEAFRKYEKLESDKVWI